MASSPPQNPTFSALLSPRKRYAYDWNEESAMTGQTSINETFKKIQIPDIIIEDGSRYHTEGEKLVTKAMSDTNLSAVGQYPSVPGNQSHFPHSEQDALLIDSRHERDAQDEVLRVTQPCPDKISQFQAEVTITAGGLLKNPEEVSRRITDTRYQPRKRPRDRSGDGHRQQRTRTRSPAHRGTPGSYRTRSSSRRRFDEKKIKRHRTFFRSPIGDRFPVHLLRDKVKAFRRLQRQFRKHGCDKLQAVWVEGRIDLLYSDIIPRKKIQAPAAAQNERKASDAISETAASNITPTKETPTKETPTKETPTKETPTKETPTKETPTKETPANEPATTEATETEDADSSDDTDDTESGSDDEPSDAQTSSDTGPRSLYMGIPDGLMRPTSGAEAKCYAYVTKALPTIRHIAREQERARGSRSQTRRPRYSQNSRGNEDNLRHLMEEGALDLFRQGGGYLMLFRMFYCELFDSRSHIMMNAPGLKIDKFTTIPELWKQTLKGSGPIKVAVFEEKDFDKLPLARVGLRHLAREQTPWDAVA
ncbi:hypothetical protein KHU50_012647 [Colletotrichum sp. SAR 10_65]|nr:hypothetical protein KHU50_012647 [Colletotrichum sp. SAR 10_65]